MILLNGRVVSAQRREQVRSQVQEFRKNYQRVPGLAVVLIGDNSASEIYVKNKIKSCREVGMESTLVRLPASASQSEMEERLHALNASPEVDGILVQLPLPGHFNEDQVLEIL